MVLLKRILYDTVGQVLKGPEAKNSPLFLCHNFNFNDFMEKEPCAKCCGVLVSSHEAMKL